MNPVKRITVLLAEDHAVVRSGLRKLLEDEDDIGVLDEAGNGRQAVDLAKKHRPDVVVMDIAMPLLNGVEATRQILRAAPATKVLMLSAHADDAYVANALAAGASGYLVKQTSAHTLVAAIRALEQGKTFLSPTIAKRFQKRDPASSQGRKQSPKGRLASLTSREMETLQLIAEGEANKQIAAELGISIKTVEKHRDHLMRKLDIHDTASLTRYAIAEGLVECDVRVIIV